LQLQLIQCYQTAWNGFKKGWIILCLISGLIVAFELIPRLTVNKEFKGLKTSIITLLEAMDKGDKVEVDQTMLDIRLHTAGLLHQLVKLSIYFFPLIALLTILLLARANRLVATKNNQTNSIKTLLLTSIVHVILAIIKLGAFFLFILPGIYLYVKLLFVSLIILEDNQSPLRACKESWQLTSGHFFKLFLLVAINTLIQVAASFTIIGLIPATGFVNTARAAAFQSLKTNYDN